VGLEELASELVEEYQPLDNTLFRERVLLDVSANGRFNFKKSAKALTSGARQGTRCPSNRDVPQENTKGHRVSVPLHSSARFVPGKETSLSRAQVVSTNTQRD
jgi:hypothetical protein